MTMIRKAFIFSVLLFFLISLSGCVTARKQKDLEIQGLRNQVSVLEAQIQSKDAEISNLRDSLATKEVRVSKKKIIIGEVKSRPNAKQIQIALQNAGYNPGAIDGRMGKLTHDAIKAFQKANNLPANGKAGKKTWSLLREYLYKKVK